MDTMPRLVTSLGGQPYGSIPKIITNAGSKSCPCSTVVFKMDSYDRIFGWYLTAQIAPFPRVAGQLRDYLDGGRDRD